MAMSYDEGGRELVKLSPIQVFARRPGMFTSDLSMTGILGYIKEPDVLHATGGARVKLIEAYVHVLAWMHDESGIADIDTSREDELAAITKRFITAKQLLTELDLEFSL